jgi:hypothetical protein
MGVADLGVLRPAAVGDGEPHLEGASGRVGVRGIAIGRGGSVAEVPGPRHDSPVRIGAAVAEDAGQLLAIDHEVGPGRLVLGRRLWR